MTARKPTGDSFETWVDRQIREAEARGEFKDLPGAGKPIPGIDKPRDEMWWVRQKLTREKLTYTHPNLMLRKQAEEALAAAASAGSEAEARAIIEDINARIVDAIRKPSSGPPLNLMPYDVEKIVQDWCEQHS